MSCNCSIKYKGLTCEQYVKCAKNTCKHGSTCTKHAVSDDVLCTCVVGAIGQRCEHNINDCKNVTCNNGGSCIDFLNGFLCNCTAGWSGQFCEVDINECASNPCLQGSTCIDEINRYKCECALGKSGKNCFDDEACYSKRNFSQSLGLFRLVKSNALLALSVQENTLRVLRYSSIYCYVDVYVQEPGNVWKWLLK